MARSDEKLSEGESVLHQSRLHWIGLLREILVTLLALAVLLFFLLAWQPATWLYWVLLGAWAITCFRGVTNWLTTEVVITDRRILYRRGLLSKAGWELPVDRILDVAFSQSLLQRLVGSGDLLVESAAGDDRNALRNVPDPEGVKQKINEAREALEDRRIDRVSGAGHGTSRAEQLELVTRLHQEGALTDDEYAAEKRRILSEP